MRIKTFIASAMLAGVASATPNVASAQLWTNWNGAVACNSSVSGALGAATVTYTGTFTAVQRADGSDVCTGISQSGGQGDNYWQRGGVNSGAYSQTPDNLSFVQYQGAATSGVITFSQAVIDPWIALISVGQPSLLTQITFSSPFTIVSRNNTSSTLAYWDASADTDSYVSGNTLFATEFSGLIQFKGTYTSLRISSTGENWHGFTVGTPGLAVPEPASLSLIGAGLLAMGAVARRRTRA